MTAIHSVSSHEKARPEDMTPVLGRCCLHFASPAIEGSSASGVY